MLDFKFHGALKKYFNLQLESKARFIFVAVLFVVNYANNSTVNELACC